MTDAELIHDLQEVHYTVADQRTTIDDLVVDIELLNEECDALLARLAEVRFWRFAAIIEAIAVAALLIGIFTR